MSNCKFACAPAHAFEHSSHTQCIVQILLILLLRLGILLLLGLGIRITGVEDLTEAERWRSKSNRLQLCQCLLLLLRNLLSYPTGILGMPYRNRRRLVRPLRWWWLPHGGTGLRGTLMKLLWLCGLWCWWDGSCWSCLVSLQLIVFPYVCVESVTELLLTTPPKAMVKFMDDRSQPVYKRIPLPACSRFELIQYLLIKGNHLLAALLNASQESVFCRCYLIVVPASRC